MEFIELIQGFNKSRNKNVGIYLEIKNPEFHQKNKKDITKLVIQTLRKYGYENKKISISSVLTPRHLKESKRNLNLKLNLFSLLQIILGPKVRQIMIPF